MKIYIIAAALLTPLAAFASETYTVSMTDVNRIVCPDTVKDVFFSEEKGLISKVSGTDVFLKFPVTITIDQETQEKTTSYSTQAAEVFLVCGETTHSLILKPAKIPAQTIILKPEAEPVSKMPEYRGKDEEEILAGIMKAAIEDRLPVGFKKVKKNIVTEQLRSGGTLKVVYWQEHAGHGYRVKEYHLFSPVEITLLPAEAAAFKGVNNPAAILFTAETFKGWSRAFVIERGGK